MPKIWGGFSKWPSPGAKNMKITWKSLSRMAKYIVCCNMLFLFCLNMQSVLCKSQFLTVLCDQPITSGSDMYPELVAKALQVHLHACPLIANLYFDEWLCYFFVAEHLTVQFIPLATARCTRHNLPVVMDTHMLAHNAYVSQLQCSCLTL